MNIYKCLNEITLYIEENLENVINYEILAKFLGVNIYTMSRLFTMLAGISLSEYIRKRRLSSAAYDLCESNLKIMDIAMKYQYENATSFSRAFEKFHGIKPSQVNKKIKLKNFPRVVFDEKINLVTELNYEIVTLNEMNLYGISISINNNVIGTEAPLFFKKVEDMYLKKYGKIKYGMVTYNMKRKDSQKYYCLYDKKIEEFDYIFIPRSKWLKFKVNTQDSKDIQNLSYRFYKEFLPCCRFNLKELPELEYYHDDITDFLVAIY